MSRLLSTTALCLFSFGAVAADLPRRSAAPVPAPIYFAPAFTWTGFYVGAQMGYGWNDIDGRVRDGDGVSAAWGQENDGLLSGLHLGYNWQVGAFVLGLEGDIELSAIDGSASGSFGSIWNLTDVSIGAKTETNWQASLRLRAGYAMGATLLYLTGGLAYADMDNTLFGSSATGDRSFSFGSSRTGWTLGAGLEYGFSPNWSARMEYRYTDFGAGSTALTAATWYYDAGVVRREVTQQSIRVGLSYRFGGASAASMPVIAAY